MPKIQYESGGLAVRPRGRRNKQGATREFAMCNPVAIRFPSLPRWKWVHAHIRTPGCHTL